MAEAAAQLVALKNLQQQAYELIVERILGLVPGFQPGTRLDITALAEQLGVSQTPIKDSLRLLQAHGLIEMSPRRGTFVASLTEHQFDEYVDVLRELELAALRLAPAKLPVAALQRLREQIELARVEVAAGHEIEAHRADQRFHEALVSLSGNNELLSLYRSPRGYRLAAAYRSRDQAEEDALLQQHVAIGDALARGDRALASEHVTVHWEDCRRLGHRAIAQLARARDD